MPIEEEMNEWFVFSMLSSSNMEAEMWHFLQNLFAAYLLEIILEIRNGWMSSIFISCFISPLI